MILVFLKFLVRIDSLGVSSRKAPSITGTKGNSAIPKTMPLHSAAATITDSLVLTHRNTCNPPQHIFSLFRAWENYVAI